jgi:TolA-binding protein
MALALGTSSCAKTSKNFYFGSYSEAEKHYGKQEYEQAVTKYRAYLDENPQGNLAVIAQYYLGKSYAALGKTDEARMQFQKVANEHPDLVWANFSRTQLQELENAAPAPAA